MRESRSLRDYWDTNLDPFNWKHLSEDQVDPAFKKASRVFLSPEVKYALSALGTIKGKRLLLLGCGLGQGTIPLARMGATVTGADISHGRIELARKMVRGHELESSVSFKVADAADMPFEDKSFDLILSQDVLMYTKRKDVLREASRLLSDGGKAAFVESMRDNPYVRLFRRFRSDDATRSLTRHLAWQDMQSLDADDLQLITVKAYYFFSVLSFAILYLLRNVLLYRLTLAVLNPIDSLLMPFFEKKAWKGVAVYEKR